MNTVKTILLATLITFSSQISATTSTPPADDLKSVSQQIQTFLNNSEISINNEILVTVKFKLDDTNKIILISNDSDNYEISKFIRTRLNLKELSIDKDSSHKFYYVPVKFSSSDD